MTDPANVQGSNSIKLIQQFQKQTEHPRVPEAARRSSELSRRSLHNGSSNKLIQDNVVSAVQYQNSVGDPPARQEVALKGTFMHKMNQTQKKLQRKLRGRGNSQMDPVSNPVGSQADQEETPTQPSITPQPNQGLPGLEGDNGYQRQDSEVIAMSEIPPGRLFGSSAFDEGLFYDDNIGSETEVINDQELYNTPQGPTHQRVGSLSNLQREIDMILASNIDERMKQKMIEEVEQKYQRYRGKKKNAFAGAPIKSSKHPDVRSKTTNKKKKKYANPEGEIPPNEIFFQDQDGRERRQYVAVGDSFADRSMAHHGSDPRFESADPTLRHKKPKTKKARKLKQGALQSAKANHRAEADGQNKKYLLPEVSEFQHQDHSRDHDYLTQDEMTYYTNQHHHLGRKLKARTKRTQRKRNDSHSRSPSISPRGPTLHTAKRNRFCECCNGMEHQSSADEGPKPRNYYIQKGTVSPKQARGSAKHVAANRSQSNLSLNQTRARVDSSMSRDAPYNPHLYSEHSPPHHRKMKDSIEHGSSKFIKNKGMTPGRIRVSDRKQMENLPNVNRQASHMVNGPDKRRHKANKVNRLYDTGGPTTMQPINNRSDSMPKIEKQKSNFTTGPYDRAVDGRSDNEVPYMTPAQHARKSRESLPSDAKSYRHPKAGNRGNHPASYTSQGTVNPYDKRNKDDILSNSINFERKGLAGVPNQKDQSLGQFYNSGKSWKGTLGPAAAREGQAFPGFGQQTPGEVASQQDSLGNTHKSGQGVIATGKWGGDTPLIPEPADSQYHREPALGSLRGAKQQDMSKSREPNNMYEWDLDGRRHIKGTIPKVNIGNLIKSMHSQNPGDMEHRLVQARNSKLVDSQQSSGFIPGASQSLHNPRSDNAPIQASGTSGKKKYKVGRETPADVRMQGGISTQPIAGHLTLKKEKTAPSVSYTDNTKRDGTLSPKIMSQVSKDRSSVSPDEGLAPSCGPLSGVQANVHQGYDTQSNEAYQMSVAAKSNKTGRGHTTDHEGPRYTSKNVGSSHILRSQKTPNEKLLTSASKGSRRVLIEDNYIHSSGQSNRSDSDARSNSKSVSSRNKFISQSQKAKTNHSNKTRSSMIRPEEKQGWKKRESSISPDREGLSAYDSSLTPAQRDSLSQVMKVAARKSSDTEASPTKKLMKELTNYKARIDDETALLINGKELLTREGIKGKIASVGVGFGTGRHTSGRRSILPEIIEKVSPMKKSVSKSRKTLPPNEPPFIPIVKETLEEATQTPPAPTVRLPKIQKPEMVSQGCDPVSVRTHHKSISPKTPSAQSIGLSARTPSPAPDLASVGLNAAVESMKSIRDAHDQVTEGRFEPLMESANVQTGAELIDTFYRKETVGVETNTDPVAFENKKQFDSIMVQTEPLVNEDRDLVIEHQSLALPDEPTQASTEENSESADQLKEPVDEQPFVLEIPQPQEPEEDDQKDWAQSSLYEYVKKNSFNKLVKKGLISADDVENERPDTPASQKGMTEKERQDYNLNPLNLNILTPMECEYGQALMRKKSTTFCSPEERKDLFERAKTTIEVLTANMVRPDLCSNIMYQHYTECNNKNTIKLLIRCRKLYDARVEVIAILKNVIEAEELLKPKGPVVRIMQDDSDKPLDDSYHNLILKTLDQLSKNLMMITIFQTEQLLFSNEFYFNKVEYREAMRIQGEIMGGFLLKKQKDNPALQLNGYLSQVHEHDEHNTQELAYKQWLREFVEKHGKLDLPDKTVLKMYDVKSSKGKSRVAEAIANMPPEKKKTTVKREKKQKPRLTEMMPDENQFDIKSPSQQLVERTEEPWKRETGEFEIQAEATAIRQDSKGSVESNNQERSLKSREAAASGELHSRNPIRNNLNQVRSQATDVHQTTAHIGKLNYASDCAVTQLDKTEPSDIVNSSKMPRFIAAQSPSDVTPCEYSDNTGIPHNTRHHPMHSSNYVNEQSFDQPRSIHQSRSKESFNKSQDIDVVQLRVGNPLAPNRGIIGGARGLGQTKKSESLNRDSTANLMSSQQTIPQGAAHEILRNSQNIALSQRSEFTMPHDCSEKIRVAYSDLESAQNITEMDAALASDSGSVAGSQVFRGLKQNSKDSAFGKFKSSTGIRDKMYFRGDESEQDDLPTQQVNKEGVRMIERSETPVNVE